MKSVKESILDRRSVRRYERDTISEEQMALIYEAIRNTPTSYNGQQFSVIDVTDQAVKEQIYMLTGQKQIKTCNHFLLFLMDYNKIELIADAKNLDMPDFTSTVDGVIVGVVGETLGPGSCPIGYARTAAPEALASLMKLPEKTFVVCGLAIGVPREHPDLKPKQPESLVIHKGYYRSDRDAMTDELLAYDAEVGEYNRTREGTKSDNDWASHIVDYYREAMNYRMLRALQRRGFDVAK